MEVVQLRWPGEEARRRELAERQVPRLLVVEPEEQPPIVLDPLEDWVRRSTDRMDVDARSESLRRRARVGAQAVPRLDADGLVHTTAGWVPLPPIEAKLAACLLQRLGAVVARDELIRQAWPGDELVKRNLLDVRILRLRRRVEPVGLTIRTVRSRGYVMELVAPA
jgi:DNA-binding response OmpR family regulator